MSIKRIEKKLLGAIRELIFGLEDGLVSTVGAVAGVAAGTNNGFPAFMAIDNGGWDRGIHLRE